MIPITKPYFNNKETEAVKKVISSGWLVQGPKVKEFEDRISRFTGAKYAIAVSSCTTGLHLSLVALGIKAGDEVIVPAFTFSATANAVEQQGAKPIFVDIDTNTFNIDVSKIEEAITEKTKAIIPVHLFGLSAEMEKIMKIAKRHKLSVIEDAACALGTKYRNKHVGNFGDTGCFSFHPRKAITTGEGGMIITNSKKIAKKLKSLRDHGANISDFFRHKNDSFNLPDHNLAGFNYRMTDIQGALGIEQMKKLEFILKERKKRAEIYNKAFKNNSHIFTPFISENSNHTYQSYVLRTEKDREKLAEKLIKSGISVRPGTQSVPHLSYYHDKYGYKKSDFSKSFNIEKQSLTIPLFSTMPKREQNFVIKSIRKFYEKIAKV
jgi:perosamine synthetase